MPRARMAVDRLADVAEHGRHPRRHLAWMVIGVRIFPFRVPVFLFLVKGLVDYRVFPPDLRHHFGPGTYRKVYAATLAGITAVEYLASR